MIPYAVRESGLMRCCRQSLDEAMQKATDPPKDGDVLVCNPCLEQMVFRDGAWEWEFARQPQQPVSQP